MSEGPQVAVLNAPQTIEVLDPSNGLNYHGQTMDPNHPDNKVCPKRKRPHHPRYSKPNSTQYTSWIRVLSSMADGASNYQLRSEADQFRQSESLVNILERSYRCKEGNEGELTELDFIIRCGYTGEIKTLEDMDDDEKKANSNVSIEILSEQEDYLQVEGSTSVKGDKICIPKRRKTAKDWLQWGKIKRHLAYINAIALSNTSIVNFFRDPYGRSLSISQLMSYPPPNETNMVNDDLICNRPDNIVISYVGGEIKEQIARFYFPANLLNNVGYLYDSKKENDRRMIANELYELIKNGEIEITFTQFKVTGAVSNGEKRFHSHCDDAEDENVTAMIMFTQLLQSADEFQKSQLSKEDIFKIINQKIRFTGRLIHNHILPYSEVKNWCEFMHRNEGYIKVRVIQTPHEKLVKATQNIFDFHNAHGVVL